MFRRASEAYFGYEASLCARLSAYIPRLANKWTLRIIILGYVLFDVLKYAYLFRLTFSWLAKLR